MPTICIKTASYNDSGLKPVIFEMIDTIKPDLVKTDSRVLIKPGFLVPAGQDAAVQPHPSVIKAVAEYILAKGGHPVIGDSPPAGHFNAIIESGGYKETLKGLDVEFREFTDTVKIDIGHPFGKIDIARDVVEADAVINIPKIKTHSRMMLTLGLNNMFGCIVGPDKALWHIETQFDRNRFAALLVKICRAVNPSFTIMDGITALEGQGPGMSGTPRPLGIIAGSDSTAALDMAACRLLGADPDAIPTISEAKKNGITGNSIHIYGDFNIVNDFKLPGIEPIKSGSEKLQPMVRKYIMQRPVANNRKCSFCGQCWEICPARAVICHMEKIYFDYEKCIRCYTCLEVCPEGAIRAIQPVYGKIMQRFIETDELDHH